EPEPAPEVSSDDPFDGITDDEIATYSDLFDIPPPENDDDATKLGNKIRQWLKDGKPKPGESKDEYEDKGDDEEEVQKPDEDKPKKKKGRFGFLRR
ncbi:MAG: signal recognition particle-docking protein FtsY, partial [Nitrosopumilus sp.]